MASPQIRSASNQSVLSYQEVAKCTPFTRPYQVDGARLGLQTQLLLAGLAAVGGEQIHNMLSNWECASAIQAQSPTKLVSG